MIPVNLEATMHIAKTHAMACRLDVESTPRKGPETHLNRGNALQLLLEAANCSDAANDPADCWRLPAEAW